MTDQQPNALRLANDAMCRLPGNDGAEIAAELRRLHADGPLIQRGTDGNGNPVMGTMRRVMGDYRIAAETEAQHANELRAELSRLQADAIQTGIALQYWQDRCAQVERLQAGGQGVVPIYQYRKADGTWIDQDKHSYDYNVQDGALNVRILYAHPPAAPALVPLNRAQRDEVFMSAERRMVRDFTLPWRHALVEEVERAHGFAQAVARECEQAVFASSNPSTHEGRS